MKKIKKNPPRKETLEKYNQCHGDNGRFCSGGGGGGGGGGSATAPEMAGSGEFMKPEEMSEEFRPPTHMAVTESYSVKLLVNNQGIPDEEALALVEKVDNMAAAAKTTSISKVELKKLDQETFAQCEFSWVETPKGIEASSTIAIDVTKRHMADLGWEQDQHDISKNTMPWLVSGYSKSKEDNQNGLIAHEIGHAKMGEHVVKKPAHMWADPDNPLMGDKAWVGTIEDAASDGWKGVSQYARQSTGEMFAECMAAQAVIGTSGNKEVDKYIKDVVAHG